MAQTSNDITTSTTTQTLLKKPKILYPLDYKINDSRPNKLATNHTLFVSLLITALRFSKPTLVVVARVNIELRRRFPARPMEGVKRKHRDDCEVDGKRRKAEEADGPGKETTTVMEDEIQEFFAILRRIHMAANFFKSGDGKLTAEGRRALLTCESETEDLDGEDGVKEGESKSAEFSAETKTGLDLNLEPPSKESFV